MFCSYSRRACCCVVVGGGGGVAGVADKLFRGFELGLFKYLGKILSSNMSGRTSQQKKTMRPVVVCSAHLWSEKINDNDLMAATASFSQAFAMLCCFATILLSFELNAARQK